MNRQFKTATERRKVEEKKQAQIWKYNCWQREQELVRIPFPGYWPNRLKSCLCLRIRAFCTWRQNLSQNPAQSQSSGWVPLTLRLLLSLYWGRKPLSPTYFCELNSSGSTWSRSRTPMGDCDPDVRIAQAPKLKSNLTKSKDVKGRIQWCSETPLA